MHALYDTISGDAGRDRITYVDIEGRTGPVFRRDPDRYFADDGYHPSAAGYTQMASQVPAPK